MKSTISRGRLLAGAALGFGLAFAPQQAQAACTVSPAATPVTGTVTCADTTTTDTTYAGVSPSVHREYEVDTSGGDVTGTVSAGATVDGFGLAFTNTVGGANDLIIVNDGTIQADGDPLAGGNDALTVTLIGATNFNYSGTGDITHLGTTGTAFQVNMDGTGDAVIDIGGNLTSAAGAGNDVGNGLFVNGAEGNVTVTTAVGTTIQADWVGILIDGDVAGTGDISVTNNAAVGSLTGAPGTLFLGVGIENSGTGDSTIVNNGDVGSATDRTENIGVYIQQFNAAGGAV